MNEWRIADPRTAGFHPDRLERARRWQEERLGGAPYRALVVRDAGIVAEWVSGIERDAVVTIASAAKSIYANLLGIAVAEGRIGSIEDRVAEYYPEMLDVPEGRGPKPGRYAFEKDRDITFEQIISNTSGYMKPGEDPGTVFNYQTFAMNVLTHTIARLYGAYDTDAPDRSPGFRSLIDEKIARPIGAAFEYSLSNFDHPPEARLGVFGYYCAVHTAARDAARLGLLWCNRGEWDGRQVVPAEWIKRSVRVAPPIIANCPEKQWCYGYGTWTNEKGKLWPNLPRDGFTASGNGGHYITVFPSESLVIVQNPRHYSGPESRANPEFLELVLGALA